MENTKQMENAKQLTETVSWSVFIGSMFIGMGVDAFFGSAGVGTLVGMGVGYIASAIVESKMK